MYALDEIFDEVRASNLTGEALGDELLRLTAIYNYIPEDLTDQYRLAVLAAYLESQEEESE